MKTYKILSVLILFALIFTACKNDDEQTTTYDSVGLLTGLDMALCACCGNWLIEIEGEQNTRQFQELPSNSGIDLSNAVFPVSVSLNWTVSNAGCEHIIISEIVEN